MGERGRRSRVDTERWEHPHPTLPLKGEDFREDTCMLLPTSLVGSYAQPEWLIDRAKLAGRFPPRTRQKELWRIPEDMIEPLARYYAAR